jgi:transcriptional regulator with XRE-family HTH domain
MCAVPFCRITLRGRKSEPPGYPAAPATLGGHLRRRRLDLGLLQEEVARELGVKTGTVTKWELGLNPVSGAFLPAVIRFLGYDPAPEASSLPARLRAARQRLGITQKELARRLGVNPKTLRKWEDGRVERRYPRMTALLEEFLAEEAHAAEPEE